MTGQELTALAWRAVGSPEKPVEFARALGLEGDSRAQRVKRWRSGENEPDYEGTIKMLAAAGLLREEADLTAPPPANRLGRIEELLEVLLAEIRELREDDEPQSAAD